VEAVEAATGQQAEAEVGADGLCRRGLRRPLALAFAVACFNQLSGINAVLYFAPRIFEMAGLGHAAALLQSVGIGLTNLLGTLLGLRLIDQLGRRTLLAIGGVGYILSLGGCSWAFAAGRTGLVPPFIFAFVGSHAMCVAPPFSRRRGAPLTSASEPIIMEPCFKAAGCCSRCEPGTGA
jgi:SP family arabinose:H+ symporter-like MFS transporter